MNYVQRLFLVIAALLSLGIPFLFIGIQVPHAMHSAILSEAAEYVILDHEDEDFWIKIPGRTGLLDIKSFYLFNCTNPDEVVLNNAEPRYEEVGPFNYRYRHEFKDIVYHGDDDMDNTRVNFTKHFENTPWNAEDPQQEYTVINLSGLKKWENVKHKSRFQLAIEGFFEIFAYSRTHFVRDLGIRELIDYYEKIEHIRELTRNLTDVSNDVIIALSTDLNYALVREQNVYEWTMMCDTAYPYIEHEIMNYFNFSVKNFEVVKQRFCEKYFALYDKNHKTSCTKGNIDFAYCTDYNISFSQWMYGTIVPTYMNVTFKQLHGIYEFHSYISKFFELIKPEFKWQFENINWSDKSYHFLLDTYFEYPDFKTDSASLLLFKNMKRLYEAGDATEKPFKGNAKSNQEAQEVMIDLSRFEDVAKDLLVSKEQAFMFYCYFEYFVDSTVLLKQLGGTIESERVANFGAVVLRDIADYCRDYLDLLIYSQTLHRYEPTESCENKVEKYFNTTQAKEIMTQLKKAICHNTLFHSNLAEPRGWKYFLEAVSFPYAYFYARLLYYLSVEIPGFKNTILIEMLYSEDSAFYITQKRIKADVKAHYKKATNDQVCEQKFSSFCTKRQLFIGQIHLAAITRHPYPGSGLPATDYIDGWWKLIQPYIENDNIPFEGDPPIQRPLPDLPIQVPIEIPYLEKYYEKKHSLTKQDFFACFTFIKLFDTDVIYDVFLHRGSVPPVNCSQFANMFFYNSTRYWIRSIQFGPMYKSLKAEEAIFGYLDGFMRIEHKVFDYLQGDDCTVNPFIGYNPSSLGNDKTFGYLAYPNTMDTGLRKNKNIRTFLQYYGAFMLGYQKLNFDETGDQCYFELDSAFTEVVELGDFTDGFQFAQSQGKTPQNHKLNFLDFNVFRPLTLTRRNDPSYTHRDLDVNAYFMNIASDYRCHRGLYVENSIDMTSFLQHTSIFTRPRLDKIHEPDMIIPRHINYTHPLDKDDVPDGYDKADSYFLIEPYTGITMKFQKKLMLSLLLKYDELYQKRNATYNRELVPYYALYEKAEVSEAFVATMKSSILSSQRTRQVISVVFVAFGGIFNCLGVILIIRACLLKPEQITGIPSSVPDASTMDNQMEKEEPTPPLIAEGEDLQQESQNTELKIYNPADDAEANPNGDASENLLP